MVLKGNLSIFTLSNKIRPRQTKLRENEVFSRKNHVFTFTQNKMVLRQRKNKAWAYK